MINDIKGLTALVSTYDPFCHAIWLADVETVEKQKGNRWGLCGFTIYVPFSSNSARYDPVGVEGGVIYEPKYDIIKPISKETFVQTTLGLIDPVDLRKSIIEEATKTEYEPIRNKGTSP